MDPFEDQSVSPTDAEHQDVTSSAATSTAVDDNPDSSPEAHDEPEETFGEAIERAMQSEQDDAEPDPEAADPETATDPEGEKAPDGDEAAGEEGATETDDEGEDLQEGQRVPYDRFRKVITQRNEYRERIGTVEQERDTYRTGHEQFGAIQGFMRENDLRSQDVAEALQIAAMFNKDPARALEALKGKMQGLQEFVGETLPADLQARVDSGEIDQADAQQQVRLRNENARLQQQHQQAQQRQQQEAQAQQTRQVRNSMAQAANDAQTQLAKADPDFQRKYPMIERELRILIQQQQPRNAEQAAQLVRQAHQTVTQQLAQMAPRRQVRPGPSSTASGNATSSRREPQSMTEAIQMAMNQTE